MQATRTLRNRPPHALVSWQRHSLPTDLKHPKQQVAATALWQMRRALHCSQRRMVQSTMPPTEARPDRLCRVYNVSGALIRFEQTWIWQQRLFRERLDWQRQKPRVPGHDVLLMVEHNDIYTLGRRSSLDHLKFDPFSGYCEHEVRRTERGGEVTWHGPGQLVAYPIMDLNYHKKDLHWYLRQLEEVVIQVLERNGLKGEREPEHTGVWVGGAKIAAIGLNASSWITTHGFSLNVISDLEPFDSIVPCGIEGRPVTRMCDLVPLETLTQYIETGGFMRKVRSDVMMAFEDVFEVDMDVRQVDDVFHSEVMEKKIFPVMRNRQLVEELEEESKLQLILARLP